MNKVPRKEKDWKEQRVPKAHDLVRKVNQQWNCYSEKNKYLNRLKINLKLKSTFNSTNSSFLDNPHVKKLFKI